MANCPSFYRGRSQHEAYPSPFFLDLRNWSLDVDGMGRLPASSMALWRREKLGSSRGLRVNGWIIALKMFYLSEILEFLGLVGLIIYRCACRMVILCVQCRASLFPIHLEILFCMDYTPVQFGNPTWLNLECGMCIKDTQSWALRVVHKLKCNQKFAESHEELRGRKWNYSSQVIYNNSILSKFIFTSRSHLRYSNLWFPRISLCIFLCNNCSQGIIGFEI